VFALSVVDEPGEEPLSLDAAKLHLRIDLDDDSEDALISGLIVAARRLTEKECGQAWVERTLKLTLAAWPCRSPWENFPDAIGIPVSPVTDVGSVKYRAIDGTLTTLDAGNYQTWLDHSPPLIAPAPLSWWPVLQAGWMSAVEVEFTAGYGTADDVPEDAVNLMKLCVGYWYEHRGDGDDPAKLGLPPGAVRLVNLLASTGYR
jgi:uncharacterized phiE125 gp8 family phage protein